MSSFGIVISLLAVVVIITAPLVILLKPGKKDTGQPPALPTPPAEGIAPPPINRDVCPGCPAQVDPSAHFCDKCGAKLK